MPPKARRSTESEWQVCPIRTYQEVADEMTRRGHPITRNSIAFYERSAFRKLAEALETENVL